MKGILLINTGSPEESNRQGVKDFLRAMLSDPYVMTVPDWFRPILVNGIITPSRQFTSASHYQKIWDYEHNASPLLYNMKQLAEKLEALTEMPVEAAMRYGQPAIRLALERLMAKNNRLHEVVVLPLFPQYAKSSYKTAVDEVGKIFFERPYPFRLKFVEAYFKHAAYIKALAESIKPYIENNDFDKLVFSFHSLPLSHVEEGWRKGKEFDYVYQVKETVRLVLKELELYVKKTRLVYHSAMGRKWLGPNLNETMTDLAEGGQKKVLVIAPGFAVDNLETLYDINIKARDLFLRKGGTHFSYIPCLNSEDYWVEGISKIIP